MRDHVLFEYTSTSGILSRLHPWIKLAGLTAICIITAAVPPAVLIPPAALLLFLLFNSGKSVFRQFAGMWKLFIFFIISGLIKGLTGRSAVGGVIFTSRLVMMSAAGLLFYTSTRISALRPGLKRLFSHIPFISGTHIADMLIMALAFLPVIFKLINEQRQARYSRLFNPRRNFIKTIKLTSVPLMIEMFIKTDEMADAWYSRGYLNN